MFDRREFIQLAGALAAIPSASVAATPQPGFAGRLSRMIFLEDVSSLVARSLAIPAPAAKAISSNHSLFLAGGRLDSASASPNATMAIAAGRNAVTAYAPLAPHDDRKRLEWDARLLRELSVRTGLGAAPVSTSDIAGLFETMSRRVLIGIHTYIPDDQDVEQWMERLIRLHDSAHSYWAQLAAAFQSARVAVDAAYDASDPIIRAVSAVPRGPLDRADLERALSATPKSAYGRALLDAHARLVAS
jgi:hypothetical protein